MTGKQHTSETIREEGVNVHLALLLRNRGIRARAERRSRKGIPDVRIHLKGGDLLILECKWAGSASLLEDQLDRRLSPNPPKDTDGRREESGRGMGELQGK